ncbi:MAG: SDR family oxidoreductase [Planctomycetes bacterium]|nr:SDR family oxidoreductase [Planctomycetota bacterium]
MASSKKRRNFPRARSADSATSPAREPPRELAGLRAVVTGSSSGIGRAIAIELAAAGAAVIVHARQSAQDAKETARRCRKLGASAEVLLADLSRPAERQRFIERVESIFPAVDIWVNNAGADILTGSNRRLSFEEKLELLWRVDVEGTIFLSRLVGGRMRERGRGLIVNMSWDQAQTGMEGESGELFAAAKGAVLAFTKSLALSVAPEVRVNCVAPGWIRTRWGETAPRSWQERVRSETPLQRWGEPEDVAKVVRFLASPQAGFITGQVVAVNGGAVR